MSEPTGYLKIHEGRVTFVAHEGPLSFEQMRPVMDAETLALPWCSQFAPRGVAIVIDDEGRLRQELYHTPGAERDSMRPARVTCWICRARTAVAVSDLCGVVLLVGQGEDEGEGGEPCGAPLSRLLAVLREVFLVCPADVYVPADDPITTVVSFDDPEAFLRYFGGRASSPRSSPRGG